MRQTTKTSRKIQQTVFVKRQQEIGKMLRRLMKEGFVAPITSGSPPNLDRMQLSDFEVTADGRKVLACITDQTPLTSEMTEDGQVVAIFSHASCSQCQFLSVCLVKRYQGNYRLKYELPDLATSKRREQQETAHFKERYKIRSGIEATISEANRLTSLKRSWTRGKNALACRSFSKPWP